MTVEEKAVSLNDIQKYGNESDKVYLHINDVMTLLSEQNKSVRNQTIKEACEWLEENTWINGFLFTIEDFIEGMKK